MSAATLVLHTTDGFGPVPCCPAVGTADSDCDDDKDGLPGFACRRMIRARVSRKAQKMRRRTDYALVECGQPIRAPSRPEIRDGKERLANTVPQRGKHSTSTDQTRAPRLQPR
ncbi:hypothetical protein AMAG_18636 [Allomyces macrogynus ATCC 38327]|uniref:Uncharacterized protein n=1 Tax=Allomyces macrogynus (strain ATCC 38327) TaxID=578462 RepID=A0A0L0SG52_ALLM3|nr:hypothetical protein AMAG_18636 [Allomyces macrogynus ATCC 38327]|eukprot:KNE61471.1 hypothetical protein AMAG_18636 [Allomyces macrogynus ATCC 38327]